MTRLTAMCTPLLLLAHCQTEEIKSGGGEPQLMPSALITSCCLVSPRGLLCVRAGCAAGAPLSRPKTFQTERHCLEAFNLHGSDLTCRGGTARGSNAV